MTGPVVRGAWGATVLALLAGDADCATLQALLVGPGKDATLARLRDLRIDSLVYFAVAPDAAAQRLYDKVWAVQRRWLVHICGGLRDAGVNPVVVKGAELTERFFAPRALSLMADCDLLVERAAMVEAMRVLYGAGLRPAYFDADLGSLVDRDIQQIGSIEEQHYELPAFRKLVALDLEPDEIEVASAMGSPVVIAGGEVRLLVEFDVHHGLATDIPGEPLLAKVVPSAHDGAMTLSTADHVWFTSSRLYAEVALHGKRSLRDIAFLARLVVCREVDWDVVLAAAETHNLHCGLYYYLRFCDERLGAPVPPHVIAALDPRRGSRMCDWGWQLGTLFDTIDPCPL